MSKSLRNTVIVTIACLPLLVLTGCNPAALYLAPDYDARTPRSIAFFPLSDSLMNDEATKDVMSWFEKRIKGRDYDVVSMATTDLLLSKARISRAVDTSAAAIARICSVTEADAVMFFAMAPSAGDYNVVFRSDELHVDLHLFAKDGQPLWKQKIDESSTQIGLLGALNNKIDIWTDGYTRSLPNGKGDGILR